MSYRPHFTNGKKQSRWRTFTGAIYAAYTVPFTPKRDRSIFIEYARAVGTGVQPKQPPLSEELEAVRKIAKEKIKHGTLTYLAGTELLGLMGVLMQFMCYDERLRPYAQTAFADVEQLYQACVKAGAKRPLRFSDQLGIALEQTDGNVPESLWLLMITCRLHARWADTSVITGVPDFSREEIMKRMLIWNHSLAACKPAGSVVFQDAAGDVYYCWTHALAQVAYTVLPKRRTLLMRLELFALHNGTWLNRNVGEKFTPQTVPTNHSIAAEYGNAIGAQLDEYLKQKTAR